MPGTQHAFEFLDSPTAGDFPPVCVLFGDEDLLKRLVKQRLREGILSADGDSPFTTFSGDESDWRDVVDEAATMSLFGGGSKRLVIVEAADGFVSKFRTRLEDYVDKPRRTAVLVLEVGTWASNTKLYKAVHSHGLQIDCRLPLQSGKRTEIDQPRVVAWLVRRARQNYNSTLSKAAAQVLIDLAGLQLGMLDQDLAKLSLFVTADQAITPELVQQVVGGWRTKTVWEMVEAAADGNASEALKQLELALQSGEHPQALFGQIAWSLRRFTAATRCFVTAEKSGRRITLRDALEQAGFRAWPQQALPNAERQIKQLGRERAGHLLHWLLEADLALKGSHSSPDRARFVLEHLFLRMARGAAPETVR